MKNVKAENEDQWKSWAIAAQNGDAESYRQLLGGIHAPIRRFVLRKMGNIENVEDIVQESLIAIHNSLHTFRPDQSFSAWFFTIARYKMVDKIREIERKMRKEREFAENSVTEVQDPANTLLEEERDAESLREAVQESLSKLPQEMKEAVELTRIQGLSTSEAADRLGIKPGALRTRISRAYQLLRKSLEGELV